MSKDYEYEYNRKQKVWDPNERHTREDTLTEGVVGLVGLVGIVGVTAIVTGLVSKKVRSNIVKIFRRPPAAPKPGPRAPRPLLRTLNPLCTPPYDKKASTASGNEPIQPFQLTASTFDRQSPAAEAEAEEQLTEAEADAEAEATKASNSLLNRYLNASVDQYPKHPIDWSEGCAKAKRTTALRFRSIVAPEEQPLAPVTDSTTHSSPCGSAQLASLKLAASHFDQQAPAPEAEQNITEAEAEATKASNSLVNRYLNASVGQYPKHPIDSSEGCAKAKLTTALRFRSIEAEQAPLPVPDSSIPLPTTQVVNLFKNSNLVAAEISRLETSKNFEQFAETQRPTVTPETLELTVPGTVEVTEIETANIAVTTGNADIAAPCVKADITDPTVNEDITASAVKAGITVPTVKAAITASAVKADITTAAGNAKITATSEEADISNTAEKANKTAIAGKEDITESSKLSERVQ